MLPKIRGFRLKKQKSRAFNDFLSILKIDNEKLQSQHICSGDFL